MGIDRVNSNGKWRAFCVLVAKVIRNKWVMLTYIVKSHFHLIPEKEGSRDVA